MKQLIASTLIALIGFLPNYAHSAPDLDQRVKSFRETLAALIQADTSNPPGNESRAVKILADHLKKEGIPYEIIEFAPGRQNLVARLKGTGEKKPLLLLAHIDVVGTKDQNWSSPPHEMTEKDGYLVGRGVWDDLGPAVLNLETLIALNHDMKSSGLKPRRDLIAVFAGDEESDSAGIRYLIEKRPDVLDAEIALNEGGSIKLDENGNVHYIAMQVAEKIYQDFILVAKGPSGHSSIPKKGNPIYRLARALDRLGNYQPKERLLPLTREYFRQRATLEKPALAHAMLALANSKGSLTQSGLKNDLQLIRENPIHAAMLSTTCVATLLSAGTKVNALPTEARASVNCRLLPDESVDDVHKLLTKIVNDPEIEIRMDGVPGSKSPSPDLMGEVPTVLRKLAKETWPNAPVLPVMQNSTTDSLYLRQRNIQAYGFFPLGLSEQDYLRAHGVDERLPIAGIRPGIDFMYRLVQQLVASAP
jgi:acetylornithine deacetylase/succinyl-diaminopimelate desuccinylase-like protein